MNRLYFKDKKNIVAFCIFISLALGLMIMIFCLSSQNAEISSDTSGGLIRFAIGIVNPDFQELSATEQENIISSLQFFVRKSAHASAYMLLGLCLSGAALQLEGVKPVLRAVLGFIIAVLYSISDEIHQLFIPGRSGELRDVLIDSSGAVVGTLIIFVIWILIKNKNAIFKKQRP